MGIGLTWPGTRPTAEDIIRAGGEKSPEEESGDEDCISSSNSDANRHRFGTGLADQAQLRPLKADIDGADDETKGKESVRDEGIGG